MADMMYLRSRGRVLGPFDEDKLKSLARRGQLNRMHELSTDGVSWQRATHFPHLFEMGSVSHSDDNHAVPTLPHAENTPQASAVQTTEEWYYAINNVEHGPVQFPQLQALVASGPLSATDLVWKEGMANWTPVSQVSGLVPSNASAAGTGYVGTPQPQMNVPDPYSPPQSHQNSYTEPSQPRPRRESKSGLVCSILSIVFAVVSLGLCPPLFGLAGFVCGIIGIVSSSNKTLGIIGLVLSILCPVIGMVVGAALMMAV